MRQVWALIVLFAGGCVANIPLPLVDPGTPVPDPSGTVLIHVPGTSGNTVFDDKWTKGLLKGRLEAHVEHFEWTRPDKRHLTALRATEDNQKESQVLTDRLTQLVRAQPHRRIILTSQSGGPMIAIWALERLPDDVHIDTLVMLNPAVSPDYDLSKALAHVRGRAYAFTSNQDWLYNGLGTNVICLMDGRRGFGAGFAGFHRPATASLAEYDKLVQVEHHWAWIKYGNFGHHTGALSTGMAESVISPLLQTGMLPQ